MKKRKNETRSEQERREMKTRVGEQMAEETSKEKKMLKLCGYKE